MRCLKLMSLCLLLAAGASLPAVAPREASAQGLCAKVNQVVKKVKKRGCVTDKDVANNSLTQEDMKNEAGANFALGGGVDRTAPVQPTVYASVDIVTPGFGQIVVSAYVQMSTTTPQRLGGALACKIDVKKTPGDPRPPDGITQALPANQVAGSVSRGEKWVETMLWSETIQVTGKGRSKFDLVCQRLNAPEDTFGFTSFMVAEYFPRLY